MHITTRMAADSDYPAIMALVIELAVFQNAAAKVHNSAEQMLSDKDLFHCIVAETDDKTIIGVATYFFGYYTWFGKSLYLDDLYVSHAFRGNKAGRLLLHKLFDIARTSGCKKVRWQVSEWNKPAIDFYKRLGGHIDTEFYNCDFDEQAIHAIANNDIL